MIPQRNRDDRDLRAFQTPSGASTSCRLVWAIHERVKGALAARKAEVAFTDAEQRLLLGSWVRAPITIKMQPTGDMTESPPRVFISYSHDSDEHRRNVLAFAQSLRGNGIDAVLDQYVESDPPLSWPQWMTNQIDSSDFVILVMTPEYRLRFLGRQPPGTGKGVRWESLIITSDLYHEAREHVKFIPVLIADESPSCIPSPLSLTTFYLVGSPPDFDLDRLLRHLLHRPAAAPAALGPPPSLGVEPPQEIAQVEQAYANALDDQAGAQEQLQDFLRSPDPKVAAAAAYNLGRLHARSGLLVRAISAYQRALDYGRESGVAEPAARGLQSALESMQAHMGPGGPVAAAAEWLGLVKAGKMNEAWVRIDRTTRLVLAQAWVFVNRDHPQVAAFDRDELAAALSQQSPRHRLARDFFATQLNEFRQAFAAYDSEKWGAAERPRRFDLDYELVIFMETGGDAIVWEQGTELRSFPFLMRRELATWYVASFEAARLIPGWPPSKEQLPMDGVRFRPGPGAPSG